MNLKKLFLCLVLIVPIKAYSNPVVIPDVKVSVIDQSAAQAREKAIAQGHRIAFHKALAQLSLDADAVGGAPTDDEIISMAKSFSPEREKQTSTSYAASFTFQFDDETLIAWANGMSSSQDGDLVSQGESSYFVPTHALGSMDGLPTGQAASMREQYIRVVIPIQGLGDVLAMERIFDQVPGVRGYPLKVLTRDMAEYELRIFGDPRELVVPFAEKGYTLEPRGTQFMLTPQFRSIG